MKEHPILFSAPMVRALLDDSKTKTRRTVTRLSGFGSVTEFQASDTAGYAWQFRDSRMLWNDIDDKRLIDCCPYGQPGDRLWVRETFAKIIGQTAGWIETDYFATYKHGDRMGDLMGVKKKWKPSIFMPRDASRITLEITGVRVERVQDISEADAKAEGVFGVDWGHGMDYGGSACYVKPYMALWDQINVKRAPWASNPWVWVIEFKRLLKEQHGNSNTTGREPTQGGSK